MVSWLIKHKVKAGYNKYQATYCVKYNVAQLKFKESRENDFNLFIANFYLNRPDSMYALLEHRDDMSSFILSQYELGFTNRALWISLYQLADTITLNMITLHDMH